MFDQGAAILDRLAVPADDAAALVDHLCALEDLKNAASAEQARLAAELATIRHDEDAARGVRSERRGRGVAAEVALARRESGHRGQQHLALARVLPAEMPATWSAFRAGRITEWRCQLLLRETACLTRADRLRIDVELAGNPERLEAMGDGEAVDEARRLAYRLDPASFVERRRRAEADRHVSVRPPPDLMTQVSALLPVKEGVAVHAALKAAADAHVARGDERSRGQVMADTLVARITGRADSAEEPDIQVTVHVVVPDAVLTGESDETGHVDGFGPIPADHARDLAEDATWLQRLYATPETGDLVAMDARGRLFPDALKRFLRLRDRVCRMPWCDAPVRHADHAADAATGGPTSAGNGQALCEAHNHAKQAHGWTARPRPGPRHTVETVTPTGHSYVSTAPPARSPAYMETRPGLWTLIA